MAGFGNHTDMATKREKKASTTKITHTLNMIYVWIFKNMFFTIKVPAIW